MHTHARRQAGTHTHTHTHTLSLSLSLSLTHSLILSLADFGSVYMTYKSNETN